MVDPIPRLHAVGEGDRPARRGRGPGLAVVLIGLYAAAFGAALWAFKTRAAAPPPGKARDAAASQVARPAGPRGKLDRQELFSGAGLDPEARAQYLQHLAIDCCDCGCDLTLSKCLVGDQTCARSAQMAEDRRKASE